MHLSFRRLMSSTSVPPKYLRFAKNKLAHSFLVDENAAILVPALVGYIVLPIASIKAEAMLRSDRAPLGPPLL